MKTSLFQRFLNWLKSDKVKQWAIKHWKLILAIIAIIILLIVLRVRDHIIKAQAADLARDNYIIENAQKDRQALEKELVALEKAYVIIERRGDSLKLLLYLKDKEFDKEKARHQREIDSLVNVPPDTAYKKLQLIYPNYDSGDLRFPFSASQVKPIYQTALSYPRLTEEFNLQTNILGTCRELNKNYESQVNNLNKQVDNLTLNIQKANTEITAYKDKTVVLQKQVNGNKTMKRIYFTAAAVLAGIVILK